MATGSIYLVTAVSSSEEALF